MINYWPTYRVSRDPFFGFRDLQREMNRLFEGIQEGGTRYPLLNLWSNDEGVVVTAEIPGVDPDKIDITVLKNQLTIKGEREIPQPEEGVVQHCGERVAGSFERTVQLPFEVEDDGVTATCRQGVLTVTLPRSEVTKPKRIQIAAGK